MTLHQELTDIILRAMIHNDYVRQADEVYANEAAGAVIEKIISLFEDEEKNIPEKRVLSKESPRDYLQYDKGYNHAWSDWRDYYDTLKDLLTEGKEK